MSNKDFYKQYSNLLASGASINDLQNFLIELTRAENPNLDFIKEVGQDIVALQNGATIGKIQNRVLGSSVESTLNQDTPQIRNTKILSSKGWAKKTILIGGAVVALGAIVSPLAFNNSNHSTKVEAAGDVQKDQDVAKYTKLEVKEGTTFNVNDFNSVITNGGTLKKETAEAGYADSYDALNKKYIVKKDEDIIKLIYALNYEEIDPLQLANLANFGITMSAEDLNNEMNQFYNFMLWDSVTVTEDKKSEIDFTKIVSREKDANYLMEAQRSNQRFNAAKTHDERVKVAKEELGKWIPILENKADLPTNQAVLSILQAQLDGFVENMSLNLVKWDEIGISKSKWANIAWDLPKCETLTDDQLAEEGYSAYWRGNVRTEDSDISLTRWRRYDAFENMIKKVNDVRDNKNATRLTNDNITLAELEKAIHDSAVKQNDGKEIEVIPNPDFTKAILDELANDKGGVIGLRDDETYVRGPNGNYVLKNNPKIDESSNLPTEKEAEEQVKEESNNMSQEAKDMEPAGYQSAVSSGAMDMNGMKMPSGLSEAEKNGYRAGYSEGISHNKIAYQLGKEGQALTSELAACTKAYNAGKAEYEANKKQEDKNEQQENDNYQQLVDEAYSAGHSAGLAAGKDAKPSVPSKYQSVSSDYIRGFEEGQYEASMNIGKIEDVTSTGEETKAPEKEEPSQQQPAEPTTPEKEPEKPQEEVSTVTEAEVVQAARADAFSRLYNGDYIIPNANTTMTACPEKYKAFEASWNESWNQVLTGYLMNAGTTTKTASEAPAEAKVAPVAETTPAPVKEETPVAQATVEAPVEQVQETSISEEIEQLKQLRQTLDEVEKQNQELDELIHNTGKTL